MTKSNDLSYNVLAGEVFGEPAWLLIREDGHCCGYRKSKQEAQALHNKFKGKQ